MVPLGPVQGDEQPPALPQEQEQLRGEPLIVDPGVAQEPIEAIHGTAHLNPESDGQVARHGQGGRLGHLGNRSNDQGEGLPLRSAKGA